MAVTQSWTQRALDSAWDIIINNWYLGFIAFGGPPVHFQIVRRLQLYFSVINWFIYSFLFWGNSQCFECWLIGYIVPRKICD